MVGDSPLGCVFAIFKFLCDSAVVVGFADAFSTFVDEPLTSNGAVGAVGLGKEVLGNESNLAGAVGNQIFTSGTFGPLNVHRRRHIVDPYNSGFGCTLLVCTSNHPFKLVGYCIAQIGNTAFGQCALLNRYAIDSGSLSPLCATFEDVPMSSSVFGKYAGKVDCRLTVGRATSTRIGVETIILDGNSAYRGTLRTIGHLINYGVLEYSIFKMLNTSVLYSMAIYNIASNTHEMTVVSGELLKFGADDIEVGGLVAIEGKNLGRLTYFGLGACCDCGRHGIVGDVDVVGIFALAELNIPNETCSIERELIDNEHCVALRGKLASSGYTCQIGLAETSSCAAEILDRPPARSTGWQRRIEGIAVVATVYIINSYACIGVSLDTVYIDSNLLIACTGLFAALGNCPTEGVRASSGQAGDVDEIVAISNSTKSDVVLIDGACRPINESPLASSTFRFYFIGFQ